MTSCCFPGQCRPFKMAVACGVLSFMASFMLSFFLLDVLDGIWDLIESVSEGFLTYSTLKENNLPLGEQILFLRVDL